MPRIAELKLIDGELWCKLDVVRPQAFVDGSAISIYTDKEIAEKSRNDRYWLITDLLTHLQITKEELAAYGQP